jgi:hypothetical protein
VYLFRGVYHQRFVRIFQLAEDAKKTSEGLKAFMTKKTQA